MWTQQIAQKYARWDGNRYCGRAIPGGRTTEDIRDHEGTSAGRI